MKTMWQSTENQKINSLNPLLLEGWVDKKDIYFLIFNEFV